MYQPLSDFGETGTASPARIELLSFRLGEDEYCIDIMAVREIRGWTRPTPLPHAPPHLRGVINLRGTVIPVIDLAVRLGMPEVGGQIRNVFIIVSHGGQLSGLLVHAVSDILSVPRAELRPPPDVSNYAEQNFIEALSIIDGRMIRLINLPAILPDPAHEAT